MALPVPWILLLFTIAPCILTPAASTKTKLNIGLLIPYTGWDIGEFMGSAAVTALDTINAAQLLNDYEVIFNVKNTACEKSTGVRGAMQQWESYRMNGTDLHGFIGGGCSSMCEPVALIAGALDKPFISFGCTSDELSNKKNFPTFTRVVTPWTSLAPMYPALMMQYDWGRVAIVADVTLGVMTTLAQEIKREIETIPGKTALYYTIDSIYQWKGSPDYEAKKEHVKSLLLDIKEQSRILILLMYDDDNLEVMLLAEEVGMAEGDYIFMNLEIFTSYWENADAADLVRAQKAYKGFVVSMPADELTGGGRAAFANDVVADFNHPFFVNANPPLPAGTTDPSKVMVLYASLMHDAVMMWAYSLNQTLGLGYNIDNGSDISSHIIGKKINLDPQYLKSGDIYINELGDRKQNYDFLIGGQGATGKEERPLYRWLAGEGILTSIHSETDEFTWSGGRTAPPPDEPECGWDNELCPDNTTNYIIISVVVLFVVILVLSLVAFYVYRRMKFEAELTQILLWKADWADISLDVGKALGASKATLKETKTYASLASGAEKQVFTEIGAYKGKTVAIKKIEKGSVNIQDRPILIELKQMRDMNHENVNQFIAACVDAPNVSYLMAYCQKGSLQDILQNEAINLTWDFKMSLSTDVAKGMHYIHQSVFGSHGHLTSSNCVVDSRWTCKVTDFGMGLFKAGSEIDDELNISARLVWSAPELLRLKQFPTYGSAQGDIYSFGIILSEIACKDGPFAFNVPEVDPEDVVRRVAAGERPPFRPTIPSDACEKPWRNLVEQCWNEDPELRPSFARIRSLLKEINGGRQINVIDNMIRMLEQHAEHLEDLVNERTAELAVEKKKVETLLFNILPRSVAEELKQGRQIAPEDFDAVTIYFSDIVGFTSLAAASTPIQVVGLLNALYSLFDETLDHYDVYKVETIGDAYMVVSGLPERNGDRHAGEICGMSLHLLSGISSFRIPHLPERQLQLRIGVHTGPCVSGVVGMKMPRYCLFGDTVNTASRMESNSMALRIHMSDPTAQLLFKLGGFHLDCRGEIPIKGKGTMTTWWLTGKDGFDLPLPDMSKAASAAEHEFK